MRRGREAGAPLSLSVRVSRDAYRFLHHLEELGHPELDRTDGLDRALEGDGEGWRGEGREGGGGGGDGGGVACSCHAVAVVLAEAARRTLKGTISPSPEIIADIARSSSNFTFAMFSKHFLRWGCTHEGREWGRCEKWRGRRWRR